MQGFGSTPVSPGPRPEPSGTGGIAAGLMSTQGPLSATQARMQFNLVQEKVAQGKLLGHRDYLVRCGNHSLHPVLSSYSPGYSGQGKSFRMAATPGPQLLSPDYHAVNAKRNGDSLPLLVGQLPRQVRHLRGILSTVVAAILRQALFNRVQPRNSDRESTLSEIATRQWRELLN
ncbi:hypothetical protein MRX96_012343 [Rhipicephalus microplus]